MGSLEDKVREDINTKFGSVPKMAKEVGMAATTIYHALDRGLENTNSRTKKLIYEALYGSVEYVPSGLSKDEEELVELYRSLSARGRRAVLTGLRDFTGNQ